MNDKFTNKTNPEADDLAQKLQSLAEQTQPNPHFVHELEGRLREAHQPKVASLFAWREITPTLGWAALVIAVGLLLIWSIRTLVPAPQPATNGTPVKQDLPGLFVKPTSPVINSDTATPAPDNTGYDFRGAKLYLKQPLPESPAQANIYQMKQDQQATAEEVRGLAARFGLQGEMYIAYDYVFSVNNYYFTDGKQALEVYSDRRFNYIADLSQNNRYFPGTPLPNADTIISDFLQAHGFTFPFKIRFADFFGGYRVDPLAPDGLPMQYEAFTFPPMLVKLDQAGNVFSIDATLIDFEAASVGTYGIISAQEALDKLLNDNEPGGKLEFFASASNQQSQEWRSYPDDQTLTIHGYVSSNPPVDSNQPPFIVIDGVPAIGNTTGMEKLDRNTFIEATGQYLVENGLRQFKVDTWNSNIEEVYVSGTLRSEGDQIILTSDDGSGKEYQLIDPPTDLPLNTKPPDSQLAVSGVIIDGKMDWIYIQYFENSSHGGGGGGGGLGFYQLNLSGTPMPFPSPTATASPTAIPAGEGTYTVQENDTLASIAYRFGVSVKQLAEANNLPDTNIIYLGQTLIIPGLQQQPSEQKVTDLRGFLYIVIHKKGDGTQATEYNLIINKDGAFLSYLLEGSNLNELDAHQAMPILVSGTIENKNGTNILHMDSYKIPFPDLHFQILKGTQTVSEINGQVVILFTDVNGKMYAQVSPDGSPDTSTVGRNGDQVLVESLAIPDETLGGYPALRVYSSGMAISPKNGQPVDIPITANQPFVVDDTNQPDISNYVQPNLTIESVELIYFVSNPYYQVSDPIYSLRDTKYLQPVWHFQGHYDNGDKFDAMIQALKQEFLKPEISPGLSPG